VSRIRPFPSAKLVCGIIAATDEHFDRAEEFLGPLYGPVDGRSGRFPFDFSDYYEPQMGPGLRRQFLSFEPLFAPDLLSGIKRRTNALEEEIREVLRTSRRIVNLDPGFVTSAALIMATAKAFAHRIPLRDGIYAHLEFLFARQGIRTLEWTYPDFSDGRYDRFFIQVRKCYLQQIRQAV
jgi:transposase